MNRPTAFWPVNFSDEKSSNIIEDPLYALNSFSHSAFKISLSLTFDSLITCLGVGLF